MSEITAEEKPKGNPDKPKVNRRKEKKEKASRVTKIVMRHLPPTMTETEFLEQVGPLPENDSYYYCPADWSLGQEATCRAYIDMSMKDAEEVLQFRDRFDGYVFVDTRGVEYVAIVEYAPFQSFLKNRARNDDGKVNTIESESHYQEFIQRLADEREEASRLGDVKIDFNFDRRADEKVKSTPLLQYLANKKEKRREEARKRNEEKRKQREEQKQLRLVEQAENSKTKEGGSGGGDNKKTAGKKDGKESKDSKDISAAAQGNEAAKSSRSKRRTERDQRRREEHEQRKLAKRDKKKVEGKPDKEKPFGGKDKSGKQQPKDKDIVILKKEKSESKDEADSPPTTSKAGNSDAKKDSDVPDTVRKFIQAACSLGDKDYAGAPPEAGSSQETNAEEAIKAAQFRASEERRIRNKDRPSIAIYQPKARIPRIGSEELPQNAGKEGSDGEAPSAVEEKSAKKSKRSGRRNNKSKPQEGNKERQLEARRISKSSESSNSANSAGMVK